MKNQSNGEKNDIDSRNRDFNFRTSNGILNEKNCAENEIQFSLLDGHRLICLRKNGQEELINGYILPVNFSSSTAICRDKAATSDL
jgi:hypothetical protein